MRYPPVILLFEDEPIISLDIRCLLEESGFQVIQANEVQDLLTFCEQNRPDFALLNFVFPDYRDGMALAQMLRQRFHMPVRFITGARPQDVAATAVDSGPDILYKPFSRAQLRQWINKR